MSEVHPRHFLPAAGHHRALPLYDPLVWLLGGDRVRATVLDGAALRPGQRVLDVGCGTGTLAVEIARRHPDVEVVGLDPDPDALARARHKAARAGVRRVTFERGFSDAMPWPDETFDHTFSSFVFHHLEPEVRRATAAEVRRVLKPGAAFHVLDVAATEVLAPLRDGGLEGAVEVGRRFSLFGAVARYRAARSERGAPVPQPG